MQSPIIAYIEQAKVSFVAKYGFPAERIHVSPHMEQVLARWADKNLAYPASLAERLQGAEVAGLPIFKMTKNSPHLEFYLVAERDGQLYITNLSIERDTSQDDDTRPAIQLGGDDHGES